MLSFWSFSFMNTATTKAEALEVEARSLNWINLPLVGSHRKRKKKTTTKTHKKTSDRTTHSAFRKY